METAVWGAYYNVQINLDNPHLQDDDYKTGIKDEALKLTQIAEDGARKVLKGVITRQECS